MRAIVGASIAYLLLVVSLTSPRTATAIDLVQVVSREHPLMAVAASRMSIGRDGNVYLCCGEYADGYVLRIHRDGTGKQGGKVLPRMWMAAANRDGLIATANVHFNHSVNLWSPAFEHVGAVSDFLSSDATEFRDPCDVRGRRQRQLLRHGSESQPDRSHCAAGQDGCRLSLGCRRPGLR